MVGWSARHPKGAPVSVWFTPVTPTLLSSPPAKLAFPVVEVIALHTEAAIMAAVPLSLNLGKVLLTGSRYFFPCCVADFTSQTS